MRPWCLLWIGLASASVQAQDPVHRQYTTEDGLPSNTIYSMVQDREDHMWFATDAGVSRFDGHTFHNLSVNDGLTDNNVINVAEDSKGRIWFLTLNGRLCFWLNGKVFDQRTIPDLGRYQCSAGWQSFAEDKHGRLWFAGVRSDVLRLDLEGDADTLWHWPGGSMSVVLGADREVIVVSSTNIRTQHGRTWNDHDGVVLNEANSIVRQAEVDGQRPVAIAWNGVYELNTDHWERCAEGKIDMLRWERCWIDRVGDLWVRARDSGIEQWVRRKGKYSLTRTLFRGQLINMEYADREGNRWFATARYGLIRCAEQEFNTSLWPTSGEPVLVLTRLRDDHVLVGGSDGHLYRFEQNGLRPISVEPGLQRIMDLAQDTAGRVWVATDGSVLFLDEGLQEYQEVPVEDPSRPRSHLAAGAKAVETAPGGGIWFANFGLQRVEEDARDGLLRRIVPDTVIPHDRILTLLVDNHGRVWYENDEDLHCYEDGERRDFPELNGKTGLRITSLAQWSPDTIVVGTSGAGVLFLANGRITTALTTRQGLLSDDVVRVRCWGDTLVVASSKGVRSYVGALARGAEPRSQKSYDFPSIGQVNDALIDGEMLLLASSKGLCVVPFDQGNVHVAPPKLLLKTVLVNDREVPLDTLTELTEGSGRLRAEFRAVTFARPDLVQYGFRVHPKDPWIESRVGVIELNPLGAGSYSIEMRARKSGGPWSTPIVIPCRVGPRWWNMTWVRVLLWVLVSAGLVLFTRKVLRRRFAQAMGQVRQQEALNEERRRIAADVHDDLGADLSRLLMHARKHASAGETVETAQLTGGIASAIDKIDEIIWSLDPRKDTLRSTVQFIEQQGRELAEAHGLRFRTDVDLPESDVPLAANERRELMLIAREATRNVVRHAQATTLRIDWSFSDDRLTMIVADDGIGIVEQAGSTSGRHGVSNMLERAHRLGGSLSIRSAAPHGTRVEMTMAVPRNHPIG